MHLKNLSRSLFGGTVLALAGVCASTATAQVNYYECQDLGYVTETFKTKAGLVAVSNKGSEIFLVDGSNAMKSLVASPGAGMYVNVSKDGRYVGFKSINNDAEQAPALLEVATGKVTLLENYTDQCGQVSFADDGTIAYPYGTQLIVRKGNERKTYDLGGVMNIVNLNPAGTEAAYATIDGDMFILDLATGAKTALGNQQAYRPHWSPDGTKLAIQKVNGDLLSYDKAAKRVYDLGAATSVSWADNNDLVITRSQRENEMVVKGASVMKMRFDGKNAETLVALSEGVPVSATLEGKKLLVSYANGAERGITETTFTGDVRMGAPAKVKRLARFAKGQRVGRYVAKNFGGYERPSVETLGVEGFKEYAKKLEEEQNNPNKAPLKGNDIGLTAIPYINQVWDTPAVGGSTAYGYVCCAPTSSCMMLAWYGKLENGKSWTASRSGYNPAGGTNYSKFIAIQYTSVTGYTFSTAASGGGYWGYTYGVRGGYGYMWGLGSPASMMANFHKNNGASSSWFESSWSRLVTECNANRPYVICLANGTGGHVVMVFRANQIAYSNGSGTYGKNGTFVCHDPYGDYNGSSYPNWDGRYSSYDWPGYNNGQANIGSFYWGCVTQSSGGQPTTNPTISVDKSDVHFKCQLNETPTIEVNVTGKDLSSDITVASSHSWRFEATPGTLGKTGGKLYIKMAHSEKAGTYGQNGTALAGTFYVRLKSGSTEKTINITAEVTAPPLTGVTEKYVYSVNKGNANELGYDFSKIRNFVYHDGKLYCVYDSREILVLAAQTGKKLGVLSNGSVVGAGSVALADVKVIDGVIVASNIATAAKGESLRLYAWESDEAAPYLLFETTDFQGAPRVGDCLEMSGNFKSDCWFAFGNDDGTDTRIIEYNRKDGAWTAKNTKVLKAGKQYKLGSTVRAYPKGSGWWVNGKNNFPAWTNNPGGGSCEVQCQNNTGQTRGSDHHEFYWLGLKYAINTVYDDVDGSNGRMRIIHDAAGDFSTTNEIGKWPAAGLGKAKSNVNGTGDCMVNTDGQNYLEAWVLITGQGLAYYTVNNPPAQNPQPFTPAATEKTPVIKVDKSSVSLSAKAGQTADATVNVTVSDLRENVMANLSGAGADAFSISPNNLADNGIITVTYHPEAAGTHQAVMTLTSKDAKSVSVSLTGTSESDQPVVEIGPLSFSEKWNFSQANGTLGEHGSARNMAYGDGKLYVTRNNNSIVILDAFTGQQRGSLSNGSVVAGGTYTICGIQYFCGKVYASDLVAKDGQEFRFYRWDNDSAQPVLVFSDNAHGLTRLGDNFTMSGTESDYWVTLASNPSATVGVIREYHVVNGTLVDSKSINATTSAGAVLNIGSSARAYRTSTGYAVAGAQLLPTKVDGSGKATDEVIKDPVISGNDFVEFTYDGKKYMLMTSYLNNSNATLTGGIMRLYDVTDGWKAAKVCQDGNGNSHFPTNGLGSTRNIAFSTAVAVAQPNAGQVHAWVLTTNQGLAMYTSGKSTGVDDILAEEETEAPVEFYNLNGIRVNGENLAPGLYIRRQGNKATKVLVR